MVNTFKDAALSFFSGHFYGELARMRKGIGMGLVVLLTLMMTIAFFATFVLAGYYSEVREAMARLPTMADTLPAITIKDGTLAIDKPMPYTLTLGAAPDDMRIVIDTHYKITDINALEKYMQQGKIILLATADKVITRDVQKHEDQQTQIGNSLRISDIKNSQAFSFTHDDWRALAETAKSWGMAALAPAACISLLIAVFIANFLGTVFSGLAVMALDLIAKTGLEFPAAIRLAAAFRIPVSMLSALPVLIGMHPLAGVSGWILWALYLIFAVWSVRLYGGKKAA